MKFDFYGHKILPSTYGAAALAHYRDTIARWWIWQTDPRAATILSRIVRFLRDNHRDAGFNGGPQDAAKLRELLTKNMAAAGIDGELVKKV